MEKSVPPPRRGESASTPVSKDAVATATATKGAGPATQPTTSPAKTKQAPEANLMRRRLAWTAIGAFLTTNLLMFLRFFFPRTLFEPSSRFRIGGVNDFGLGVDERFKQSHKIWIVRQPDKLFVLYARCTHLGCIPNWIETENKFKCPCHGSGYDIEGRNFEGPAPRPMDRTLVELDAEGQIVVDTSRLFACPPGGECQFSGDGSFLVVS